MKDQIISFLCVRFDHPGALLLMDESGEFVVRDCPRCGILIRSLVDDHTQEDFERVLDRWFVDWRVE